jgi:serine/threonine protein kinase
MYFKLPELELPMLEGVFGIHKSTKTHFVSDINGQKTFYKKKKFASLDVVIANLKLQPLENCYWLIDHFENISFLGSGTYASVKYAMDKTTKREIAIKISRKQNSREKLQNEYVVLQTLEHENIIKWIDLIHNDVKDESYLFLEYFEGKDLSKFMEDNNEVTFEDSIFIVNQIVLAIHYLHSNRISHRDLKPENVLINDDLKVKLIDFNISKKDKNTNINNKTNEKFSSVTFLTQISSPLYAAPELKKGRTYTESIDIWGIGIIMFTLLYGNIQQHKTSFPGDDIENHELFVEVIDCSDLFSEDIKNLLKSLLAEEPHLRPSADDLIANNVLLSN